MNFALEQIADSEFRNCGTGVPQDRLQLFFSTHDVTLSRWRLRDFPRLFRVGDVSAVKTGDARYANLPYVAEIKISQVRREPP